MAASKCSRASLSLDGGIPIRFATVLTLKDGHLIFIEI